MPATPEELRLIKEKFADVVIRFQQGSIDLPDALLAIRDFEIPSEIPIPEGAPPPPPDAGAADDDAAGTGEDGSPPEGDGTPPPADAEPPEPEPPAPDVPDPEALALASAELDEALAVALSHLRP